MGQKTPIVSARTAFIAFMEKRKLKAHPWATKAGIRSSTIYNFISGDTKGMSGSTLQKLAEAAGSTVDELLGMKPEGDDQRVPLAYVVGVHGRLFDADDIEFVARPTSAAKGLALVAARIDRDGLHPIPGGWLLFIEVEQRNPKDLLGKLAAIRMKNGAQLSVREIHRGTTPGLYTLTAWNAGPSEDVEIESAQLVHAIAQPSEPAVSQKK
jgi:DNA-binding Xre family transcriptional regulator